MATHVEKVPKKIAKLLKQHPSLKVNEETGKIWCTLTFHEMPCVEEVVKSYIEGRKFQKAYARDNNNYEKYKPHIVSSTKKGHGNQLFCKLTLRHINKTPQHVERHASGKRYQKALARWKVCQENGTKFVPNRRKRNKSDEDEFAENEKELEMNRSRGITDPAEGDDEEEEESDGDDMEDLYPAEDFKDETEDEVKKEVDNEDSDYEFEDDTGSQPVVKKQVKEKNKSKRKNKDIKPSKKKKQKVG